MKFILKGITNSNTINEMNTWSNSLVTVSHDRDKDDIELYSFDLRPRSFNFVQAKKIKSIICENPTQKKFSLIFENELPLTVTEISQGIKEVCLVDQEIYLEFAGSESLAVLETFQQDYIWHYHPEEKIKNIEKTKYLKRIVFKQEILDELNRNGELHGFFNLFSKYTERVYFEVQIDWDSEIILSLFDFFEIPLISIEINHKVELSYQLPNHTLIQDNLRKIQNLFDHL